MFDKLKLQESSLSRVLAHSQSHETAYTTAWRPSEEQSKEINTKNQKELKSKLISLGYGVTKVVGWWEGQKEPSLFVVNLKDDDSSKFALNIKKLGVKYDQDAVVVVGVGGEPAILTKTTKKDLPWLPIAFGKSKNLGKMKFKDSKEAKTLVNGKPLVFEDVGNALELIEDIPSFIAAIGYQAVKREVQNELNEGVAVKKGADISTKIQRDIRRFKLDGNGRFKSHGHGINTVHALLDQYDLQISEIIHAPRRSKMSRGPSGGSAESVSYNMEFKNPLDPFSPIPLMNKTQIRISAAELKVGSWEFLVYLTGKLNAIKVI